MVTSSFPGPLGVGDGDGAGEGAGVGVGLGAVGDGSTLPHAAAVSAAIMTATRVNVRSCVLDFVAMESPEKANLATIPPRHQCSAKRGPDTDEQLG
jgi:hypothetical protein